MSKICTKCQVEKGLGEYYKAKKATDGLRSECRECGKTSNLVWFKANPGKRNDAIRKYDESEGYSVYQATYGDQQYIGSGLAVKRRNAHLNGTSGIAKKLGTKADKFEIVFTGSKSECTAWESVLIDHIGLDNLLNKQRVVI